jgi:Arc/MetJ-type ribon-helix-helix transcriptional regulator
MDDRSGEVEKTRVSVTLTKPYLDALDRLVEEGIYLSRGEIILEALRLHLRRLKIEPFRLSEGDPEEQGEETGNHG